MIFLNTDDVCVLCCETPDGHQAQVEESYSNALILKRNDLLVQDFTDGLHGAIGVKRNDLPERDFIDGLYGATGENDNAFEYDLQSTSAPGLFTPASVLVIVVIYKL